ncbi:uncharacterized protein LOC110701541 [Chenopodium quinoa]|uniref:uncharacterized protein LOC110701541 n=1 Tax=Chenopodium quinoa TaxID=63459 RepID=UPI000B774F52|nr:uncharacterized protein LOC110701541 [Chenopodium quinoa]
MEKISATRKLVVVSAAKYHSNILNRAGDEQKTVGTPKSGSTRPSPSKQSQSKIQKTRTGDVSASGKNRKHIAHKPKRGDDSTLEADREVSKLDANQALKGCFKKPTTACRLSRREEAPWEGGGGSVGCSCAKVDRRPDGQGMLRELDPEDKASAMMCIRGLRKPLQENSKEVKKDLDSARSKINDLKAEIKGLKEKLEPLQEAKKEAKRAKERVGRLEMRLANQEKQLKAKFESRADEEKEALVKKMIEDYEAIMRTAWEAVQPGADYSTWKSKFDQANKDFNADLLRQAQEEATKAAAEGEESDSSSGSSGEEKGDEEDGENAE